METGDSSESPSQTKTKAAKKPEASSLKQSELFVFVFDVVVCLFSFVCDCLVIESPALRTRTLPDSTMLACNTRNFSGNSRIPPGKCLYTTVRERVENSLDSAESISELPVVEVTVEEIVKNKFNSMSGLIDRERVDEALYDDYETEKAREKFSSESPPITLTLLPNEYCSITWTVSLLLVHKHLAKEARDQEIQEKNVALGKKVKETSAVKAMKGRGEASFYRVTYKDNGRGMPHDDIPNMLGWGMLILFSLLCSCIAFFCFSWSLTLCSVFLGQNMALKQTRGRISELACFIGLLLLQLLTVESLTISVQALIWSKMSTGLPMEVKSAMQSQAYLSFCRLDTDIHSFMIMRLEFLKKLVLADAKLLMGILNTYRNTPHIHLHEKQENQDCWHGAEIQVVIEGNWTTY
ncbi:DNA topoisomerase 6 subunit B-like protein [Drosera capensis]